MPKMYDELALWWPLISDPADYADEAAFFLPLFAPVTAATRPGATLLELGSGGGNNALHMKGSFASVTLVDIAAGMLEVSRKLNPECLHILGDMRTLRLDQTFDAVFIHDAIEYMTTPDELRSAIRTAWVHCKPGGMALFVPDHVRETFEPTTDLGGEDGEGRSARYLEWTFDPDPNDTSYITDYVFALRVGDGLPSIEADRHVLGLFAEAEWMEMLRAIGFEAYAVTDNFNRRIFVASRPI